MSNASESEIGDTSEQYEVGGGDEEATDVVLAIATALLLGLLIRTVDGLLPRRWKDRSIPFTASVLISGLVTGIVLIYGGRRMPCLRVFVNWRVSSRRCCSPSSCPR